MWVVAPRGLFQYSTPPPTLPSSSFLMPQAIFKPNLFPYKYHNILNPSYFKLTEGCSGRLTRKPRVGRGQQASVGARTALP